MIKVYGIPNADLATRIRALVGGRVLNRRCASLLPTGQSGLDYGLTLVVWTNLTISPFDGLTANRLMLDVLDRAYKLSPLAPGGATPQPNLPGLD